MSTILKAINNNIGYYSRKELFPRIITERSKALFLLNNDFCLIWNSDGVVFIIAVEEVQSKLKIVDT